MNSTKSVCLHIPDLPCDSNGNTAIATSAFSPVEKKEHSQGKVTKYLGSNLPQQEPGVAIPQRGCRHAVNSITEQGLVTYCKCKWF